MERKPNQPEASLRPTPARHWTRLGRAACRLTLIGCLVWVGWFTAITLLEVVSGPRPAHESAKENHLDPPPLLEGFSLASADGHWRFADVPLQLHFARLSEKQASERLRQLPDESSVGRGKETGDKLLALMHMMKAPRQQEGAWGVYLLSEPSLKVVVFTRGTGQSETAVVGRLALASDSGWALLETGSKMPAFCSKNASGSLLPLPEGTQRLCERRDDDDRLVAEVTSVAVSWAELQTLWHEQGWSVEPLPGARETKTGCSCNRGRQTIQVWPQPRGANAEGVSLLMIRVPMAQVTK